jgi:hypothetical protein
VGADIDHLVILGAKHFDQGLLVFKSCVVAANGDIHEFLLWIVMWG